MPAGGAGSAQVRAQGEAQGEAQGGAPAWRVREASAADAGAIDAMVRELAAFEREPDAVEARPEDLAAALSGPAPLVHALLAEARTGEGAWEPVGTAVWFLTWSTWTGRHGIWLEDLYVRPAARRSGVATALLARLAQLADERGWRRLEWSVLDWNTGAQGAYRSVGARRHEGWSTWRLDGGALGTLAARADAGDDRA